MKVLLQSRSKLLAQVTYYLLNSSCSICDVKPAVVFILQRCFENKQVTALCVVFFIRQSWSTEVASLTVFYKWLRTGRSEWWLSEGFGVLWFGLDDKWR